MINGSYNYGKPEMGKCRFCATALKHTFVDLGMSPLCENFIRHKDLKSMEPYYPLHVYVCENCFLVQLEEFASPQEIYKDYNYYSSYSDSWLRHCKEYAGSAIRRFDLSPGNFVAEIASNDGYMLQYFLEEGIPVLGVEPSGNIAHHARSKGIQTESVFFGSGTANILAGKYGKADLIIGNNVLAHVPDINDFVRGMKLFLKPEGVISMEFPLLTNLVENNQFDTIYHEHFSYLSFTTVEKIFGYHGLTVFDVEEIPTHGGSARIFAKHTESEAHAVTGRVFDLIGMELEKGVKQLEYYVSFEEKVKEIKRKILQFLIIAKRKKKTIVGYGAPGKGNTLLNYCGIGTDFIDYTVDRNPHKQEKYLPGSRIPVFHPDVIKVTRPDYVFILPWNLRAEIMEQLSFIGEWGGSFVTPIPELNIHAVQERTDNVLAI